MKYGFVKVCSATPKIRVADVRYNTEQIIGCINESFKNGSEVTVFPELSLCGYTCGDLFNQSALKSAVEGGLSEICRATENMGTLVFVGAPVENTGRLYNCAVAICRGKILGVVPKTYLPNYGEFYERRHFSSAPDELLTVNVAGQEVPFGTKLIFCDENNARFTVSAEICEDLWAPISPSAAHCQAGANIIVNLSCSDETVGKAEYRRDLVKMQSGKLICGYVYCDAGDGESTTDTVYSGHNLICENGALLSESKLFENTLIYGDIDTEYIVSERTRMASGYYTGDRVVGYKMVMFGGGEGAGTLSRKYSKMPFVPEKDIGQRAELILSIQANGLAKRLKHTNCKSAVMGVSGGLDSSLALLVICRAFKILNKPMTDIIAVTMPGFGTTSGTKNNAVKLADSLGVTLKTVPISDSVLQHFKDIDHDVENRNTTYENAQARIRTLILMDIANDNGGMVIGTGDLSELALGWATYNGDHMSMYGVNASVPKTLISFLVRHEAEKIGGECGKVLSDILSTDISPELLPPDKSGKIAQKTESIVGPYILCDFYLYYAVRCGFAPDKVLYLAELTFKGDYDRQTLVKWLKNFYTRFFAQQFKRSCIPDGVKVGSVSLSPRGDWRMPSDAEVKVWLSSIK